jgi:hypothetical protein
MLTAGGAAREDALRLTERCPTLAPPAPASPHPPAPAGRGPRGGPRLAYPTAPAPGRVRTPCSATRTIHIWAGRPTRGQEKRLAVAVWGPRSLQTAVAVRVFASPPTALRARRAAVPAERSDFSQRAHWHTRSIRKPQSSCSRRFEPSGACVRHGSPAPRHLNAPAAPVDAPRDVRNALPQGWLGMDRGLDPRGQEGVTVWLALRPGQARGGGGRAGRTPPFPTTDPQPGHNPAWSSGGAR